MTERTVRSGAVDLWTEDLGDRSAPTIVLLSGASTQGIRWEDELCALFVAANRHVIRFDYRDTGQSSTIDFASDPYTLNELAGDVVAILDAYDIDAAHLVGASMGGAVSQVVALEHPHRVVSLTMIMSTPTGAEVAASSMGGDTSSTATLPGPSPEVVAAMTAVAMMTPTNREEEIDVVVKGVETLVGSFAPFDAERERWITGLEMDRARSWGSRTNHGLAMASSPSREGRLHEIACPTLVIHGTEDPILPFAHGQALADGIPNATLLAIPRLGHELPPASWPMVVDAIVDHSARAEQAR